MNLQIGVMGPSKSTYPLDVELSSKIEHAAEKIGELLAQKGIRVLTGGCDGVMEAAMRGAKKAGGITIGFPGPRRGSSNEYCDIEILTDVDIGSFAYSGMLSSDSLITIPTRSAGTLAEVCIAYRHKIPNIILRGFDAMYDQFLIDRYIDNSKKIKLIGAYNPQEAVEKAIEEAMKQEIKD